MQPRVLLLFYSFTDQTRRVAQAMHEAFQSAGCDVDYLEIELVDERYRLGLPVKPFWRRMLKLVLPQLLGKTAAIRFDAELASRDYQLVCIGSPTWWFYPALPINTFLRSEAAAKVLANRPFAVFTVCRALWGINLRAVKRMATKAGGTFLSSAAFVFRGNQIQSMLSFLNFLQTGTNRERYLGCKIYPFGVPSEGIEQAQAFARSLAKRLDTHRENNSTQMEN